MYRAIHAKPVYMKEIYFNFLVCEWVFLVRQAKVAKEQAEVADDFLW